MTAERYVAARCRRCGAEFLFSDRSRTPTKRRLACPPCARRDADVLALSGALESKLLARRLAGLGPAVEDRARGDFESVVDDLRRLSEELRHSGQLDPGVSD